MRSARPFRPNAHPATAQPRGGAKDHCASPMDTLRGDEGVRSRPITGLSCRHLQKWTRITM